MVGIMHELVVRKFGKDVSGRTYIESCRLETRIDTQRGYEGTSSEDWEVSEISFEPRVLNDRLYPDVPFKDRDPVSVSGAPQIPYVWSAVEQFAEPTIKNWRYP